MANDLNLCQFIGRLGADPEQRHTPSGDSVVNIRIAVGWKGKNSEGVEWVPVVFFGRIGEVVQSYCQKGSQIYVAGRFRTRQWDDKEGNKRYSTEVVASDMQLLGGKPEGSRPAQQAPATTQAPPDFDDEIPF